MITAELRRLTSTRMSVIALVALLAVPILYGGLYLWANQDPYGNLSHVPVALVVDDTGAEINGEQRNLGDEAADQLLDSDTFEWHRVDADQASTGLERGDFDFIVTLPADFSDAVASLSSDSPRQASIELRTNDANNYLASTIGSQAVARIQASVAKKVTDEAGLTLLDALHTIRVNLVDATTGATQLVDGLGTAKSGSTQLASGSAQLADGTAKLSDGAAQLRDGTAQLRDGSAQVADGAQQVAGGVDRIDSAARQVGTIAGDAAAQLPQARADIAKALADAGLDQQRMRRRQGEADSPTRSAIASRQRTPVSRRPSSRSTPSTTGRVRSPPAVPRWHPERPPRPTVRPPSPTAPHPPPRAPPSCATARRSSTAGSGSCRTVRRSCATASRRACSRSPTPTTRRGRRRPTRSPIR